VAAATLPERACARDIARTSIVFINDLGYQSAEVLDTNLPGANLLMAPGV
jgi:hypothetical protein